MIIKQIVIFITSLFLFISCNNKSLENKYENEDLLFKYLENHQKNNIDEDEYSLLIMRSKFICASCYHFNLDTLLQIIIDTNQIKPLFVLFDEEKLYLSKKEFYRNKINTLFSQNDDLESYGIMNSYPYFFHIKDKKIIRWQKILR